MKPGQENYRPPRGLSREEEVKRFLDELEQAPAGREISYTAAANARAEELAATGKLNMSALTFSGVVSPKTIRKHIRQGILKGEKKRIRGVETWLFEPEVAKSYLENVMAINAAAVRTKDNRARTVTAPPGFLTVAELVRESGLSKWAVYDCMNDGRLTAEAVGRHGAKLVMRVEADRFIAAMADKVRGPRPPKLRPRPVKSERRPLVLHSRMVLIWLILDQPEETIAGLAKDLSLAAQTVRNWAQGKSSPDDRNTGRIVAYARDRYQLRVSDELNELGRLHRAIYMASYMRKRRADKETPE